MTRGLTLIEVLVSLTLLTAIIMASASWTTIAGHSATTHLEPSRWQRSAEAILNLIHDDIVTGDFTPQDRNSSQKQEPKASIIDGALFIRSRSASPSERETMYRYRLDELTHEIQRSALGTTGPIDSRLLLAGVDAFVTSITDDLTRLTVSIRSSRFGDIHRSFALP